MFLEWMCNHTMHGAGGEATLSNCFLPKMFFRANATREDGEILTDQFHQPRYVQDYDSAFVMCIFSNPVAVTGAGGFLLIHLETGAHNTSMRHEVLHVYDSTLMCVEIHVYNFSHHRTVVTSPTLLGYEFPQPHEANGDGGSGENTPLS